MLENISNSYQTTSACSVASAICSSPRVHFKTAHMETTSCGNHGNRSGLTSLTNTHTHARTHTRHMQADRQSTEVQKEGLTEKWTEKWTAGQRREEWTEVKGTSSRNCTRRATTSRVLNAVDVDAVSAFASRNPGDRTVLIETSYNVTANI